MSAPATTVGVVQVDACGWVIRALPATPEALYEAVRQAGRALLAHLPVQAHSAEEARARRALIELLGAEPLIPGLCYAAGLDSSYRVTSACGEQTVAATTHLDRVTCPACVAALAPGAPPIEAAPLDPSPAAAEAPPSAPAPSVQPRRRGAVAISGVPLSCSHCNAQVPRHEVHAVFRTVVEGAHAGVCEACVQAALQEIRACHDRRAAAMAKAAAGAGDAR